jgi:DNA-binding response OmpR family regulator
MTKKILIVDDEQDFREMLELILEQRGYKVDMVNDGDEFLENVDKLQPNLIILDVMMPGPSTKEILDKLKEKKCKPKIILMTVVRLNKESLNELLKANKIVEYIKKPFDLDTFICSVKKYIE